MAKILIVEDEKNIAKLIEDTLHLESYETEICFDGESAFNALTNSHYDLILLDIMLPKIDGFTLVKKLEKITTPIIFLSAKNDIDSILKGLNIGIDYMTKPFEPLELLARIRLRLNKKEEYYYKDIIVNNVSREVTKSGEIKKLTPKEYDLFLLFIKNKNKIITKEEILDEIWDIHYDIETRTLDYHMKELRKKLDLKDDLITVNKIGYRLVED